MPLDTKLLAPAPNGFAIYAFSEDTLFEIDPFANTFGPEITTGLPVPIDVGFDPDGPIDTAFFQQPGSIVLYDMPSALIGSSFFPASTVVKAVSPGQGLIYVLTEFNGVLFQIDTGTSILSPVDNPETGFPFADPAVDVEVGPGGQSLFFALGGSGSIAQVDASGVSLLGQVSLPTAPTGLEVVSSPGAFGTSVQIYGGNNQLSGPGMAFEKPLTVRVLAPDLREVFQQSVSFSSDEPGVIFNPPIALTNLSGVAQTFATPPITDPLQIQASIPDDEFVTFDMNSNAPGREGLSKLGGDYQYIVEGPSPGGNPFDIPLVVGARTGGAPLDDFEITLTSPSSAVTCPGPKKTNADGEVSFTCAAHDVFFNSTVDIKVEDELGRKLEDPFHVTVVPSAAELPGPILRQSSRGLNGEVGQFLPGAIRLKISSGKGIPVDNLGVRFESGDDDLIIDPPLGVTDSQGFVQADVTLGCRSRTTITGTLNATGEQETEVSVRTMRGPAVSATKTNGDNQSGNPGQELPVPLVAVIEDVCGARVPGAPVVWDVQPPRSATLVGAFAATNNVGQISARVQLGNTSQLILVTARVGGAAATFRIETNVTTAQIVAIQGNGQSVAIGQEAMPLVVETRNSDGAPTGGVEVSFAVLGGSATLTSPETVSGSDGRASTGVRVGSQIGTVIIEARAVGLVVQFRLNVVGQLPVATSLGFVNGASFQVGLVPGSAAAIFGTGLTQLLNDQLAAGSAPFPTTLGGVRVFIAGVAAPMIFIANTNGQDQLNIQVPFTVPAPGTVSVTIDNNGAMATISGVQMLAVQPGIFQVTLAEGVFAAALHPNFEFVSPTNRASPGGTILLFVTGLGATDPPVGTNVPGPVPPAATANEVTVTVDGVEAQVLGSFYAPFQYTLYQINLVIPPGAANGNLVIQVIINGVLSQQLLIPVG